MKKWNKLLFNNWGLKLISLSIAFALWFVVISVNDPIDDKTFTNIKVNLIHTSVLTDKGKVYEVLEGTNLLRTVSFEAPKSIREKIEAGDILAEADFNEMTSTDTVPIRFSCPKYGSNVTDISGNISYVKLSVEQKVSKWIDVKCEPIGEVAEGYMIADVKLDTNRMEISGPESKIAEVSKAVVEVNVKDISNEISTRGNIRLRSAEGSDLNYDSVTQNIDNVKVSVVVYPTKEVPIKYSITGETADGYMRTGNVEMSQETVVIAGPVITLNNISDITIPAEELDVEDASEDLVKEVNLRKYLPSGVIFADKTFGGKVKVTVFIEKIEEVELDITTLNLQITNKPMNWLVEYQSEIEIPQLRIRGLAKDVSGISVENIRGIIDIEAWMNEQQMEELSSGTYQIPVEFALNTNIEQVEPVLVTLQVMTPEEYADRAKNNALTNGMQE